MTLARVAHATRAIGVGPGVLVPSLRHVAMQAAAIATLEALAPGRVAVAIGTGFTGRRLLGKPPLAWRPGRGVRGARCARCCAAKRRASTGFRSGCCTPRLRSRAAARDADPRRGERAARARRSRASSATACWRSATRRRASPGARSRVRARCSMPASGSTSARVFEALAPAIALIYHATYEGGGRRGRGPAARRTRVARGDRAGPGGAAAPRAARGALRRGARARTRAAGPGGRRDDVHRHRGRAPRALRRALSELAAAGATELAYAPAGRTSRASSARWPAWPDSARTRGPAGAGQEEQRWESARDAS